MFFGNTQSGYLVGSHLGVAFGLVFPPTTGCEPTASYDIPIATLLKFVYCSANSFAADPAFNYENIRG
jgi:hypothetical protein